MATTTNGTKNGTKSSVQRIEGVDLACVDEATVERFCLKYGVATDADLTTRVGELARKIKASTPKSKLADCDSCGGDSNVEDEVCPYCGVGGFDGASANAQLPLPAAAKPEPKKPEPAPEPAAAKPEPAAPKKRSEAKSNGKAKPAAAKPEPTPEPAPELRKVLDAGAAPEKPAKAPKAPKAKPEPKPEPTPAPEPAAAAQVEPEPATVEPPEPKPEPAAVEPTAEFVPNGSATMALDGRSTIELVEVQAKRLSSSRAVSVDEAVEGVREAKRLAVVCYWQLGAAILRCFEGDVWKQRRDEKKQPIYRGFAQFVEAELEMSPQYAYKLMDIAASFSASDVAKIGVAKLGVMLKLPPASRDKLLDEVRNGMPFTDVADAVRKLGGGEHASGRGKKDMSKAHDAAKAAKAAASADIVTGTFESKRVKVPLFARATAKGADPKRAKRLGDDPWGELVLLNGVTLRIALSHDTEGRLIAIVEARRPEKK